MAVIYKPSGRAYEYSKLACNLYDGCIHGCDYCYAPDVKRVTADQFHKEARPRPKIIEQLRHDAQRYADTKDRVLLCFTCDPYPPLSMEQGLTRRALIILKASRIPFQILTKAGRLAERDFELYGRNDAFATTLTFLDEERSMAVEPKAALPCMRIKAIQNAKSRGITTWVSLEPVMDLTESLKIIMETHEFVDLYKIGKLNHVTNNINWSRFGRSAVELCEKFGVPYYVKDDLALYMRDFTFTNTDTRTVCSSSS